MPKAQELRALALAAVTACALGASASERYRAILLPDEGRGGAMTGYFIPEIEDEVVLGFTGYLGRKGANESAAIATLRGSDGNGRIVREVGKKMGARSVCIMSLQSADAWNHIISFEDFRGVKRVGKFKAGSDLSGKVNIAPPPPGGDGDMIAMDAGQLILAGKRHGAVVGGMYSEKASHGFLWYGTTSGVSAEDDWETPILLTGRFLASEALGCPDYNDGVMRIFGRVMVAPDVWQAYVWEYDGKAVIGRAMGDITDPDSDGDGLSMSRNPLHESNETEAQNALYEGRYFGSGPGGSFTDLMLMGQGSARKYEHRGHVTVLKAAGGGSDTPILGPEGAVLAGMGGAAYVRGHHFQGIGTYMSRSGIVGPVRWMAPESRAIGFNPLATGGTTRSYYDGVDDDCDGIAMDRDGNIAGSVLGQPAVFVTTDHHSPDRVRIPKRVDQSTPLLMWNPDGETHDVFFHRVSERLRHKQRAVTIFDYERLVLHRGHEKGRVKGKIKHEVEVEKEAGAASGHPGTLLIGLWNHQKDRWVNIVRQVRVGANSTEFEMPGQASSYINDAGVMTLKLEYEFRGHVTVLKAKIDEATCTVTCGCTHL